MKKNVLLILSLLLAFVIVSCKKSSKQEALTADYLVKKLVLSVEGDTTIQTVIYTYDDQNRLLASYTDGELSSRYSYKSDTVISSIYYDSMSVVTDFILKNGRIVRSLHHPFMDSQTMIVDYKYNSKGELISLVGSDYSVDNTWKDGNLACASMSSEDYNVCYTYTDYPNLINFHPDSGISFQLDKNRSKDLIDKVIGTDLLGDTYELAYTYELDSLGRPLQIKQIRFDIVMLIYTLYY